MIRMEMRDEDVGNIFWLQVEGCKLIHNEVLFVKSDGGHPTVKAFWEFFGLVEEAVGIARVEKHRAKFWMAQQRKHGGKMNRAPASAMDGDVFGSSAITCVKDVDFHKGIYH